MDLGLNGKVAIVTGGSEGIGKGAALSLAREGAKVAICARRKDVLESAAEEIRSKASGDVEAYVCDVTDEDAVRQLIAQVHENWGRIDILVNNAGTSSAMSVENMTKDTLTSDITLKVYGALYASQADIPHLRALGGGRIINITT